jgi:4-amino-4-deoxy-L-arabinose transferase-like glycosyltransferase
MPTRERRLLLLIAALYSVLAVFYSLNTPLFEASDELWHYPMVQTIATTGQIPVQDPANTGLWRQEGSQPPLYYLLAAALTAGIDTSDLPFIRRQNPHADIGVVLPDRNVNMITHRPEYERFPWHGTVLAVYTARFFSVLLSLGTVLVTYQLGREIIPNEPAVRLGAAALVALLPMFLFISGSVNNDNLSNLLGNLLLLLIVRLVNPDRPPGIRDYILLGIVTGAGLLAKLNLGFLIPLIAAALLLVSIRQRDWRPVVLGGLISGGLTILIAGWWYLRNQQLYNDPTGLNVFLDIVGRRAVLANPAQLWSERHSFTQAFWGFFGGMNVPLPELVYLIFNLIGGLGLLSAIGYLLHRLLTGNQPGRLQIRWLPAVLSLIWPVITFVSYLRWTAETPASQGRLVFGALSAISIWITIGLIWWAPRRFRPAVLLGSAGYFGAVAFASPLLIIAPAYREIPPAAISNTTFALFSDRSGAGAIRLLQASVQTDAVQPEGFVWVDTHWAVEQPLNRDWSLFVHLVTPDGVIISQRDIYPAQGLLATSDLPAGRVWRNQVAVWVPPTAYAPMPLEVVIGWYHLPSGERLTLDERADTWSVGSTQLQPRASEQVVPNPLHINFGGLIELLGYELSSLSPAPGETVELTLYWRGLTQIENDYKVFANILDPRTLTKYAASDGMPDNWNAPTSGWQPGDIIVDRHRLSVDPNAPPGIFELELGLYREANGEFPRLRIFTPDGGQANNFIYLTRVRIRPNESEG